MTSNAIVFEGFEKRKRLKLSIISTMSLSANQNGTKPNLNLTKFVLSEFDQSALFSMFLLLPPS